MEPVYECVPGWKSSTRETRRFEDLPEAARRYLQFLEDRSGIEVGAVSVGPERNQTILTGGTRLQTLVSGLTKG